MEELGRAVKAVSPRSAGFTLLEMVAAVGILGMVIVGVATLTGQVTEETKSNAAALHLKTVGQAATTYIEKNFAAVAVNATAATPAIIQVSTLIGAGLLPAGFSVQNPYNQDTCVLVLEPASNNLEAVVVTEGGTAVDDLGLGQIASTIGGEGGAIYSTSATDMKGTMGGWQFPIGNYANANHLGEKCDGTVGAVSFAAGHPVMALWFADGSAISATLYRDAIAGNPALNTMNTPILMGAGATMVEGAPCADIGAISRHPSGAVLSCVGAVAPGNWERQGSLYWEDPVADFASLPATDGDGTVRITLDTDRAFAKKGASWNALAVDENGDLDVPNDLTVGGNVDVAGYINTAGFIKSDDYGFFEGGLTAAESGDLPTGAGEVRGYELHAAKGALGTGTGNIYAEGFAVISGVSVAGDPCGIYPNGTFARDAVGAILSCVSGAWTSPASGTYYKTGEHCGAYTSGVPMVGGTRLCMGLDPSVSCPAAFTRFGGDFGGGRIYYTCVKD